MRHGIVLAPDPNDNASAGAREERSRARLDRMRGLEVTMHVLLFLLFGLVVGALARIIVPGREPGGWLVSMLLGVGGAALGGYVGRALGWYREGEPAGFIVSLLGAIVLVAVYHAMTVNRGRWGKWGRWV
jgi:uncharacterized membrane protein YeaQ/YmgE (transglycosylase-associated protein family)